MACEVALEVGKDAVVDALQALGGEERRSKKPPTPEAPFQRVSTVTVARPWPSGCTVQMVTMLELRSRSTMPPEASEVTSTSWSRERDFVACRIQCASVPSPVPPESTR